MARLGTIEVAVDVRHELVLGTTPDGLPEVWLLYSPEPYPHGGHEDQALYLWVRRCSVYPSQESAILGLERILGHVVCWSPYDPLFPELWIGIDHRGYRWLLEPAPVQGAQP